MLVKFVVFHRDNSVDQIARQLIVGNGLAVLDVDLAENLSVPVHDHAGRFHLFELAQIVGRGFRLQFRRDDSEIDGDEDYCEQHNQRGQVKLGPRYHGRRERCGRVGIKNETGMRALKKRGIDLEGKLRRNSTENPNAKEPWQTPN